MSISRETIEATVDDIARKWVIKAIVGCVGLLMTVGVFLNYWIDTKVEARFSQVETLLSVVSKIDDRQRALDTRITKVEAAR